MPRGRRVSPRDMSRRARGESGRPLCIRSGRVCTVSRPTLMTLGAPRACVMGEARLRLCCSCVCPAVWTRELVQHALYVHQSHTRHLLSPPARTSLRGKLPEPAGTPAGTKGGRRLELARAASTRRGDRRAGRRRIMAAAGSGGRLRQQKVARRARRGDGAREEAHGSCAPLARRSRCLRRRSRPAQHGWAGGGASRAREGGFSDALGRLCSTTR